jgi:hypothetical protein
MWGGGWLLPPHSNADIPTAEKKKVYETEDGEKKKPLLLKELRREDTRPSKKNKADHLQVESTEHGASRNEAVLSSVPFYVQGGA